MRSVFAAFLLLIFAGCSQVDYNTAPHLKAFEEEDTYIMHALYAEQKGAYKAASKVYDTLYEHSGKEEYLLRSLAVLLLAKEYEEVLYRCNIILNERPSWHKVTRYKLDALNQLKRYDEALMVATDLVASTKRSGDYQRVSDIYIHLEEFEMALKYLERAYAIGYDEKVLDKLVIVMYVNLNRKKDAIAYLESHSRIHGCSQVVCNRLAGFYSEQNNIDGMLATYLRLYETYGEDVVADAIAKIYLYQKDYIKLMLFLEKYGHDNNLLLELYINNKLYKKAYELSKKLYDDEGTLVYLGQSAIFEYESAEDKEDSEMLESVMEQLKKVVKQLKDPLFLNYLGYLMIDHELGVEEGIGYVKEALQAEPDSIFYLDSLAWGYYKLERCDEAQKILKRVTEELGNSDEEVLEHLKAVNQCVEGKKN